MPKGNDARALLRAHALKHEGAWEDHPWGEDVAKVGKKVFVFFGTSGDDVGIGVKLPRSLLFARSQPFVERMGYGLDDSGWVAARFKAGDTVPIDLLKSWIDESYEAVAATTPPKRARGTRPAPRAR